MDAAALCKEVMRTGFYIYFVLHYSLLSYMRSFQRVREEEDSHSDGDKGIPSREVRVRENSFQGREGSDALHP